MTEVIRAKLRSVDGLKDPNDYERAGRLEEAISSAIMEAHGQIQGGDTPDTPRKVRFRPLSEIRAELRGAQWRIKPILEDDTLVVLFGDSDTYKSFIAIDLGLSIAHGVPWAGFQPHSGPVFYVCGEGRGGIARRVEAWHIARGIDNGTAPFFVSELPAELFEEAHARALADEIAADVESVSLEPPALIVIDTLSQNMGDGDESSNRDIAKFLRNLNACVRSRFGCCVMVIHHVGHGDKDRERGAYAIRANADARMRVAVGEDERSVTVESLKMKDGPRFDPLAFKGRVIEIPELYDSEGEQQSSLVFDRTEFTAPKAKLTAQQKTLMRMIWELLKRDKTLPPASLQTAPRPPKAGQTALSAPLLRDYVRQCGGLTDSDKPDTIARAIRRTLNSLQAARIIEVFDDWIWLADKADKGGHFENCPADTGGREADGQDISLKGCPVCPPPAASDPESASQEGEG